MNSCNPKEFVLVCLNHETKKMEVWALNSKGAKLADAITEGWEIDSLNPIPERFDVICENIKESDDLADNLGWFVRSAIRLWAKIEDIT